MCSRSTRPKPTTPELIQARAQSLAGQFVFDVQTHFVRDDFDHKELLGLNDFAAEHWNPKIKDREGAGVGAGSSSSTTSRRSTTTAIPSWRC